MMSNTHYLTMIRGLVVLLTLFVGQGEQTLETPFATM